MAPETSVAPDSSAAPETSAAPEPCVGKLFFEVVNDKAILSGESVEVFLGNGIQRWI